MFQQHQPTRTADVQTPFGKVELTFSVQGAPWLAGMGRFDSRHIDRVVDQMLGSWPQIHDQVWDVRGDAAPGPLAMARGLEYIYKEVYEIEFPELIADQIIPLDTEPPPGSLTYTYRMMQKTGTAKLVQHMSTDLPLVGYNAKEWQSPIVTVGAAYMFTVVDVERAARLEVPLEAMMAAACRWAIEYLGEQIAAVGVSSAGVPGLTNAPGIAATTKLSTGTWIAQIQAIPTATSSAPYTAVAAVSGIIGDIAAMKYQVKKSTLGLHQITDILLPVDVDAALDAVPRSPAFTNDTLRDYIESICKVKLTMWPQLDTAGASSLGRVMAYQKDKKVVKNVMSRPFTQYPPQPRNLAWIVPCIAEYGGVSAVRPLAITYMDGCD